MANDNPNAVTFSAAALHRLAAADLPVTAASPIAVLLRGKPSAPPAKPANGGAPEEGPFREALDVLARPEALVRLLATTPDDQQSTMSVAVRGGRAAAFSLEDEGLQVGPVQDLAVLADSLPASLTYSGPLAGQDVALWPSSLKVLTALWADDPDPQAALSKSETVTRLSKDGDVAGTEELLREIVRSGAVIEQGDRLVIPEALRPWLALVWSGHAAQVEYLALDPEKPLEEAVDEEGDRLFFMGPPGSRVLNRVVDGEELAQLFPGSRPPEDTVVHLSAPPREVVATAIRRLLRLERAG